MDLKSKLEVYFSLVEDKRKSTSITYTLSDILFIIMCGIICGCNSIEQIVEVMENKIEVLKKYIEIDSIPSESTLTRILSSVIPYQLELCILGIMKNVLQQECKLSIDKQIAIDGKTIRSTGKMQKYESPIHIVTALLVDNSMSLGQIAVNDKSNEIPAVRELLNSINIENTVITMDAMHCQKDTLEQIKKQKGDYIVQLKANQVALYEDVKLMFEDDSTGYKNEKDYLVFSKSEKNGGRIETRTCYVLKDFEYFSRYIDEWEGLKTIFCVNRKIEENGKVSIENSYYLSSKINCPEKLMEYTRKHWQVESFHWILDVNYDEDYCRVYDENAQKNLNLMRKIAIKMHKDFIEKTKPKRKTVSSSIVNCLTSNEKMTTFLEAI